MKVKFLGEGSPMTLTNGRAGDVNKKSRSMRRLFVSAGDGTSLLGTKRAPKKKNSPP